MQIRTTIGCTTAIIATIAALLPTVPSYAQIPNDETVDTEIATTVAESLANNANDHEDENDTVWDGNDVVAIALSQNAITIDGTGATADSNGLTITAAGTYRLSGTLTEGQIVVDCNDKGPVRLVLDDIDITCSSSAPIYNAKRTILVLVEGSENKVTDARSSTGTVVDRLYQDGTYNRRNATEPVHDHAYRHRGGQRERRSRHSGRT